jgi:hypothetical protein
MACMKAYMVVGPTNDQPRFLRSFERAVDSGVIAIVLSWSKVSDFGRDAGSGSNRQTYSASEPASLIRSAQRFALFMVLSILPR